MRRARAAYVEQFGISTVRAGMLGSLTGNTRLKPACHFCPSRHDAGFREYRLTEELIEEGVAAARKHGVAELTLMGCGCGPDDPGVLRLLETAGRAADGQVALGVNCGPVWSASALKRLAEAGVAAHTLGFGVIEREMFSFAKPGADFDAWLGFARRVGGEGLAFTAVMKYGLGWNRAQRVHGYAVSLAELRGLPRADGIKLSRFGGVERGVLAGMDPCDEDEFEAFLALARLLFPRAPIAAPRTGAGGCDLWERCGLGNRKVVWAVHAEPAGDGRTALASRLEFSL